VRSERNAISWSTVHAISLEVAQANPFVPKRPGGSNGVTHRRLFNVGRDDAYFAETRRDFGEGNYARAVDAIVVRNKDSHLLYH